MTTKKKAARIGQQLDELYPTTAIPLDHTDPFTLLVAVLLSAQTTDKKVNEVTPHLFRRFPNPEALAAAEVDDIKAIIAPIGLAPQKAKHLKGLAQQLLDKHGGEVPQDMAALEELPGVGHKTASVVMVQAFGQPAFPVDTHIHRLAERWGLASGKSVKETEEALKKLWPASEWGRRHLQIIYFGREHCPALRHDPAQCPICSWAASSRRSGAKSPRSSPLK